MGLIVGAGVKSRDLHEAGCRRIGQEMQVSEQLATKGTKRQSRNQMSEYLPPSMP
jgi:hypothetical protein